MIFGGFYSLNRGLNNINFCSSLPEAKIVCMQNQFPRKLLHPRYWGVWLFAGILYLLVKLLPYAWLMKIGVAVGWLMEKLMPYRLLVAKTNLALCFPERNWQQIYRAHVKSLGKGVFEMAMGWFLPADHFAGKVRHIGYEVVDTALNKGKGVLFLGVHTTGLDFGAPLLNSRYPVYFSYKKARNALLDYLITRGRLKSSPGVIEHQNLRQVVKKLKSGQCVWYGSDQDFGHWTKSVFAPFYGVEAYTLPYYAKIARQSGAVVIPVAGFRDSKQGGFTVRYLPPIAVEHLTEQAAATAMNHGIEQLLQGFEDQYYWIHRRFKTRPDGKAAVYPEKPSQIRRNKKQKKHKEKSN